MTEALPAPVAPAPEEQPPAEEHKPYELYLKENFNSYQYGLVDDNEALLQPFNPWYGPSTLPKPSPTTLSALKAAAHTTRKRSAFIPVSRPTPEPST